MKTHYCNECSKNKKVEYFSKTQLKRGSLCRCKSCIDESNVSTSTSSSQKVEGSLNNDSNFAREWSKEKLIFEITRNTDLELLHTESRYELISIYNANVRNENKMKELTLNDIGSIANEKQVVRAVKRKRKKATVKNLSKRTNKVRSAKTAGEKKRRIPTDEPDTDDIPLTIIKMEPPPLDRFNDDSDNYYDWSPKKLRQMTGVHDTKHYSIFNLQNIYTNIRNSLLMDTEDFSSDDSSEDSSEDSSNDASSSDDSVHSTKDSDSVIDVKLLTTVSFKKEDESNRFFKNWKRKFEVVKKYIEINDGKFPKYSYKDKNTKFGLGYWVANQRKSYRYHHDSSLGKVTNVPEGRSFRRTRMSQNRIALLESIETWTWVYKKEEV